MSNTKDQWHAFLTFVWRITAVHMLTYFIAGILAVYFMDYENLFKSGGLEHYMRPTSDPLVALGPGLQMVRGLIFAIVLWPFRSIFLDAEKGWLNLWGLFLGLGILSTFGPALGSVDGLIYTQIPPTIQFKALPELVFQSLLLSVGIWAWYRRPGKILNLIALILVVLILILGIAGYQFLQMQAS